MDFYERYLTKEPTFNYFNDLVSNLGKIRKPPVFEMSKNKLNLILVHQGLEELDSKLFDRIISIEKDLFSDIKETKIK